MPKVDKAAINTAGIMGRGTLVVSMLGAEAPAASLPQGAVFDDVTRGVVVAFETVGELDLSSPTLLAKYGAVFKTVFSLFNIGWALGSKNSWNPIITGRKKESGRGRGMRGEKVLLKTGVDRTRSKTSFYYEQVSFSSSLLLF